MIPNFTANLIYLVMHIVIVLSKPMLDNGDEFLSPDMNQQNFNDGIKSDHLTIGKLAPHVTLYMKQKLESNFKTLS